jgi:hypothetical protein
MGVQVTGMWSQEQRCWGNDLKSVRLLVLSILLSNNCPQEETRHWLRPPFLSVSSHVALFLDGSGGIRKVRQLSVCLTFPLPPPFLACIGVTSACLGPFLQGSALSLQSFSPRFPWRGPCTELKDNLWRGSGELGAHVFPTWLLIASLSLGDERLLKFV